MNTNQSTPKISYWQKFKFLVATNFKLVEVITALSITALYLANYGRTIFALNNSLFSSRNVASLKGSQYLPFLVSPIANVLSCYFLNKIVLSFLSFKIDHIQLKKIINGQQELLIFGRQIKINSLDSILISPAKLNLFSRIEATFITDSNDQQKITLFCLIPDQKYAETVFSDCDKHRPTTIVNFSTSKNWGILRRLIVFFLTDGIALVQISKNQQVALYINEQLEKSQRIVTAFKLPNDDQCHETIGYHREVKMLKSMSNLVKSGSPHVKGQGVILYGPPGTGKSTAAVNFLIDCYDDNLCYSITGSDLSQPNSIMPEFYSHIAGDQTVKKTIVSYLEYLNREIELANKNRKNSQKKYQNSVIFIDEVDRSSVVVENSLSSLAKGRVTPWQEAFIEIMDTPNYRELTRNVFLIVTTNSDARKFPKALIRPGRFGNQYHFDLPNLESARAIISHYLDHFLLNEKPIEKIDPKNSSLDVSDQDKKLLVEDILNWVNVFSDNYSLKSFTKKISQPDSSDSNNELGISFKLNGLYYNVSFQKFIELANSRLSQDKSLQQVPLTGAQISNVFSQGYSLTSSMRIDQIPLLLKLSNSPFKVLRVFIFETIIGLAHEKPINDNKSNFIDILSGNSNSNFDFFNSME